MATFSLPRADAIIQPDEEKPIHALLAAFADALVNLDAHAVSMVFHQDADFTNVWGMRVHGRKAIEEFHRPIMEGDGAGAIPSFKRADFKLLDARVRFVRDDVGCVDAMWQQTGAVHNGGDMGVRNGLLMLVVTKEADAWGIALMHNMDVPITAADENAPVSQQHRQGISATPNGGAGLRVHG